MFHDGEGGGGGGDDGDDEFYDISSYSMRL
jgi:hypothetical protein